MLVLSRKQGEQIMVDDCVQITVVEVRGGKVRLGFCAPEHVAIHRQEIYERIASTITNERSTAQANHVTLYETRSHESTEPPWRG